MSGSYSRESEKDKKPKSRPGPIKPLDTSKPPSGFEHLYAIGSRFELFHKNGEGFKAKCPVHDDNNPSLSINQGDEGGVVLHCHAGCDFNDILQAAELRKKDLMPDAEVDYKPTTPKSKPVTKTSAKVVSTTNKLKIVAEYSYVDEDGTILYQVVRYEGKEFRQRRPDGKGGWIYNVQGVRKVPYALPLLLEQEQVILVEGEKDADRLCDEGLCGTTTVAGAKSWSPDYAQYFAGKQVVILPDNDTQGRQYAADAVRDLSNVAKSIRIVELPNLPEKGDVSDWLDAGNTVEDLQQVVEQTTPLPINVISVIIGAGSSAEPEGNYRKLNNYRLDPPVLGDDAYYGLAGEFIRAVSPYTEATDACILLHLLPTVGVLVGPGIHVFAGTNQYARLFTVAIGPTNAGRKGTGFAPVDLLLKKVAGNKFWSSQRVNGLSSGEGLIAYVEDKVEYQDGNEVTIPTEKRLYVVEQEFSRVLANMGREGNVLSQIIRECFDSGDLATLTVDPRRANGTHIAVTGHITPDELKARLSLTDIFNGFCNRFLWFYTKSDKLMPHTKPIPESVYNERLVNCLKDLCEYGDYKCKQVVSMTSAAATKWAEVYERLRTDRAELTGSMTSRGAPIVLRLALIYALLDSVKKEKGKIGYALYSKNKDSELEIDVTHLQAALAVWDYCEESVYYLFAGKSGDPLGDKILDLLSSGNFSRNELRKHLSAKQKKELRAVLERLEQANLVRKTSEKQQGAGRPVEMWERV